MKSIDPEYFFGGDEYYEEDYQDFETRYIGNCLDDGCGVYDTYDQIIDDVESVGSDGEYGEFGIEDDFDGLSEEGLALAMAIGEDIGKKKIVVDNRTDDENWEKAMRYNRVYNRNQVPQHKMGPFDLYVDEIRSGKRSLFG